MNYDSTADTLAHIEAVQFFLSECEYELRKRGRMHDASKLQEPEKSVFDAVTPKLRALTYGSDEYKASLEEIGPALEHHFKHNSHHPEHYPKWECNGCFAIYEAEVNVCQRCGYNQFKLIGDVSKMDLLDVLEMLCDWKAATSRHMDGDILKSLEINRERFEISDQLYHILKNTVERMEWAQPQPAPAQAEGETK